jgi:hypothetical protein
VQAQGSGKVAGCDVSRGHAGASPPVGARGGSYTTLITEAGAEPIPVSALIPSLTDHVHAGTEGTYDVPDSLPEALAAVRDARPRGVRHRFTTIPGVAVCAVLARATSCAAIAE